MRRHQESMPSRPLITAARTEDVVPALRLSLQHLSAEDAASRLHNALQLIQQGELDPAGILVAKEADQVAGAVVCVQLAGAGGLVWPPGVAALAPAGLAEQLA